MPAAFDRLDLLSYVNRISSSLTLLSPWGAELCPAARAVFMDDSVSMILDRSRHVLSAR